MGRTVVHDPKHAARIVVRGPRHYLLDQTIKGRDAVLRLATAKDSGVMNIQGGHVRPSTATKILVFHAHGCAWSESTCGVLAAARLNTGFLVGGDDEFIIFQRFSLPFASVEIQ